MSNTSLVDLECEKTRVLPANCFWQTVDGANAHRKLLRTVPTHLYCCPAVCKVRSTTYGNGEPWPFCDAFPESVAPMPATAFGSLNMSLPDPFTY